MGLQLTYRDIKGSALTPAEGDANMRAIKTFVEALPGAPAPTVLTDQATTTWDYAQGNVATLTAYGNRTLQVTNLPAGICSGTLIFTQGSGGNYSLSLPGASASNLGLALPAGTVTILDFVKVSGTLYWNSTPFGAISAGSSGGATTQAQAATTAQNFFTAVGNAGGSLSSDQKAAINTFVSTLISNNLYDNIFEMWLVVGGVAASHRLGFKALHNLTFMGSWAHTATGSKGTGFVPYPQNGEAPDSTSPYAKTDIIPSTMLLVNDVHISYYSRTTDNLSSSAFGASDGDDSANHALRMTVKNQGTNQFFGEIGSSQQRVDNTSASPTSTGLYTLTRTASNLITGYRNGSSIGQHTGTNVGALPSSELYLNGFNNQGVVSQFSSREFAFASAGGGRAAAQESTFQQALQVLQQGLSRAV